MMVQLKSKVVLGLLMIIVGGVFIYYIATSVRVENVVTYIKPTSPTTLGYQGIIIELNPMKSEKVKLSFKLEGSENGAPQQQVFFFDENELKYLKVTNAEGSEVPYTELKVGQNIKVMEKTKLMVKPYFSIQIKIL